MRKFILVLFVLVLAGCSGHSLTGYNVKTTIGQTEYDNGQKSGYTGASVDAHFDVK